MKDALKRGRSSRLWSYGYVASCSCLYVGRLLLSSFQNRLKITENLAYSKKNLAKGFYGENFIIGLPYETEP
jgi:hypothetical protein